MVSRNPLAQVAWKLGCHSYHCIIVLTGHFFFKDTPLKNTVRSRIGFQMCYWHRRPHCRPCQENREFRIWTDEFAGNRPFVIFSHKLGTFFNIWFIICCSQLGHVHPIHFSQLGMGDPMAAHLGEARPGYLRDAATCGLIYPTTIKYQIPIHIYTVHETNPFRVPK